MAQGFTNFAGAPIGADPPPGWSEEWTASGNFRVAAGPVVEWEDIPFIVRNDFLAWNAPGVLSGQVEVFAELQSTSGGGAQAGVVLQGQTGVTSGYYASLNFGGLGFDEVAIGRFDSGILESLGSSAFPWAVNTPQSIRLRKGLDNILRVRAWPSSIAEPGTWNVVTAVDTTYSSGRVGLFALNPNGIKTFLRFGFGTDGDPAPTAPLGGSAAAAAHYYRRRRR